MVRDDPRIRKRVRDIEEEEAKTRRFHHALHPFAFKGKSDAHDKSNSPNGHYGGTPDYSAHSTPHASRTATPQPPKQKKRKRDKLRVDMIRRIDAPVRVNQMNVGGFLTDQPASPKNRQSLDLQGDQPRDRSVLEDEAVRTESPKQMSESSAQPSPAIVTPASPRQRRVSIDPTLQAPVHAAAVGGLSVPASSLAQSSAIGESSSEESEQSDSESSSDSEYRRAVIAEHPRRTSDPVPPSIRPRRGDHKDLKRVRTMDPPKALASPTQAGLPRTQTIGIQEPKVPQRDIRRVPTTALPHVGMNQPEGLRRRANTGLSGFGGPVERCRSSH